MKQFKNLTPFKGHILYGDNEHDDHEALQAFINGEPVFWRSGERVEGKIFSTEFRVTKTLVFDYKKCLSNKNGFNLCVFNFDLKFPFNVCIQFPAILKNDYPFGTEGSMSKCVDKLMFCHVNCLGKQGTAFDLT